MKPERFNPDKDLAPIPFDERVFRLAAAMKKLGLHWQPHVGCFLWDPDRFIKAESPFPGRVYFILSLPRFIEIFGSVADMIEKLVWLPTWHQARLICMQMDVTEEAIASIWQDKAKLSAGEELIRIYELIIDTLQKHRT